MQNLVLLSLGKGNLQTGFPVITAQLWENDNPYPMKFMGALPAAPDLGELYRRWQLLYSALYQRLDWFPRIEIDDADITNISYTEFNELCCELSARLNAWLDSEAFRNIDRELRTQLDPQAEICWIVETDERQLLRLPWHLWKFFERYPKAEVVLSVGEYKRRKKLPLKTRSKKIKILAIFGSSKGIDLDKDLCFLKALSGQAETNFLIEPPREKLNDRLWQEGWDILFFAGHTSSQPVTRLRAAMPAEYSPNSTSQEQCQLRLNNTESLNLEQLQYALNKAIEQGLKLAIFNSCDGLGLAEYLVRLQLPQAIVMRESIPDVVAQEFLKHFLAAFSSGKSLYAAVREARERLQKLEQNYPCATWLPVIFQNPAEVPSSWQDWRDRPHNFFSRAFPKVRLATALLTSALSAALILGVRQVGLLEGWELQAFDSLIRLRSPEKLDPRLTIVTVSEEDVSQQNPQERRGSSVSDAALEKLLQKLESYQPQVIGMDIYRDFPVSEKHPALKKYLQQSDGAIAVCEVGGTNERAGIAPPPEIPPDRLSFSDVLVDRDGVIRRQLLGMSKDDRSPCVADNSFSFRVAFAYLSARGLSVQRNPQGDLQVGDTVLRKLQPFSGGYHRLDDLGYQILLNYRARAPVAQQVTLSSIIHGSLDAEIAKAIEGDLVLIGTTAQSFGDYAVTPYNIDREFQAMPGVIIQAHAVSQIISAVLDKRPLLWWLPEWGEAFWILGWSGVGGLLVWRSRSLLSLILASGIALGMLYGVCFIFLLKGGWLPLLPSALSLIGSLGGLATYKALPSQKIKAEQ
jgi:CHASE2 domain-containing sensor protein